MVMSKVNKVLAWVALLALLCTAIIIAAGIWFASAQAGECARLERWRVVILGVVALVVALAGFVGAYWNKRFLLRCYLLFMAALIAVLIALLVFASVVTHASGEYKVLGRGYHEYRLDGFSTWLRGYVSDDPARWEGIMSCLADSDTCKKLARQAGFVTADQFYQSSLSPLQSGCCKPPPECGFGYVSPTVWTNPTSAPVQDCGLWSNDPAQLCYQCDSCRAGLLATLRSQWHKVYVTLIVVTAALSILYVVAWTAYRNVSGKPIFGRYYKW
ncbi:tetraspanin-2-like [Lolium perenne]|jgi:hypothetical protein|uniref:tetraspanin-2-like n=1 Tax=Lolium perenne TaxID=4522 RepID=UPI0021EA91CB|nr:tetraspanin-2-like [Lolium perenne]